MKKIGVVGFGRFGSLLAKLATGTFDVHVVEPDSAHSQSAQAAGYKLIEFSSLGEMDIIFLAVPISNLKDVIERLAPLVDEKHVVVDICSVKVYPALLMKQHLTRSQLLATHPMFGPDSAKLGLKGLQVAFCPIAIDDENAKVIEDFWRSYGVDVIKTTPEEHDQDAAYSLAFTHSISRVIIGMDAPELTFTTRSYNAIMEVAKLCANDSEQLFHDMLVYNPYFIDMEKKLESSFETTERKLDEFETEQIAADLFYAGESPQTQSTSIS